MRLLPQYVIFLSQSHLSFDDAILQLLNPQLTVSDMVGCQQIKCKLQTHMKGLTFQEQIKTAQFINHTQYQIHNHPHNQQQQKQIKMGQEYAIKITNQIKQFPKPSFFQKHNHHKIVVIQTLDNVTHKQDTKNKDMKRQKHTKNKSVDFQDIKGINYDRSNLLAEQQGIKMKGKVTINSQFISQFRGRNTISEMKQYNFSKKIAPNRKYNQQGHPIKKKKATSNYQGDLKELKKEVKSLMVQTNITAQHKKKTTSGKTIKTHKQSSQSKIAKIVSKSMEVFTDRKKQIPKQKQKPKTEQIFTNFGITMPLTSKLQSLYSNTTSVFSSRCQLQKFVNKHSYVIPTEESMDEIVEIRQFQTQALKFTRNSCSSLLKLSKVSLVQELEEQQFKQMEQLGNKTENIISYYLQLMKQHKYTDSELEMVSSEGLFINSKDMGNRKQQSKCIPASQQIKEQSKLIKKVKIDVMQQPICNQNEEENQIKKLNNIVQFIANNKQINQEQKHAILQKISNLIQNYKKQQKPSSVPPQKCIQISSGSNSQIKQLITNQQISNINLQLLDKTLRERELYLIQRERRQLLKIEERRQGMSQKEFQNEKEKIKKWNQYQIKQVSHTRIQLWKGFNFAKQLLQKDSSKNDKNKEMMKCLSEKYIKNNSYFISQSYPINEQNRAVKHSNQQQQINKSNHQLIEQISPFRENEILHEQVLKFLDQKQQNYSYSCQSSEPDKQPVEGVQQRLIISPFDVQQTNFIETQPFSIDSDSENDYTKEKQQQSPQFKDKRPNKLRLVCEIDSDYNFNGQSQSLDKLIESRQDQPIIMPFTINLQDKEDICQYIFLDLCIEITQEWSSDSRVMKSIVKFISKIKEQSKKQKGFKTNSVAIKEYLFQFISYLKGNSELLVDIHDKLDKPMGPTALEILKYMRPNPAETTAEEQSEDSVYILNSKVFEEFQYIYLPKCTFQTYYDDEDKERRRVTFIKNAMHVHNKAIFDGLNQNLDKDRPFGLWGEPFSWKKTSKFCHERSTKYKNDIILKCAQKTIQFGSYLCGFMADKEDCNFKDNPNVTSAYIQQLRFDRLSRMLAQDLQQTQEKMLFIDDEQTEILVEMTESLSQLLIMEATQQLSYLLGFA